VDNKTARQNNSNKRFTMVKNRPNALSFRVGFKVVWVHRHII
jgi:hypothetical protein